MDYPAPRVLNSDPRCQTLVGVGLTFLTGLLGLARTWPSLNIWTHGTPITSMHGHMAFVGAYVMISLVIISFAPPHFRD